MPGDPDVTRLLQRLHGGDRAAADELLPLVYEELRRIAERCMEGERSGHTLQPTALVHETFLRLVPEGGAPHLEGRAHFLRVAARAMRRILVDHARARDAEKRGGGRRPVALDDVLEAFAERDLDVLELSDAVEKLGAVDPELARLVELRFFAGLTIAETAEALGVSTPTVERHWRVARLWLARELGEG